MMHICFHIPHLQNIYVLFLLAKFTMKYTNFIGLFALMLIMTIGLTIVPVYGQASTTTLRDKFTFSDRTPNPCNGEFVSFDGTISFVSHFANTPNGESITNFNLQSTGNGQGDLSNT
jgi:hypothetical protein